MPRKSGGQKIQAPNNGAYGNRQALENAQAAVPLPQQAPPPTPSAPAPAPPAAATPAAPGQVAQDRLAQALAAAQGASFSGGGLGAPSQRPTEPVTSGLPVGAGPGPPQKRGLADTMHDLATLTGDSSVAYLAQLVRGAGW